ncbi:ubiquitin-conjugating enzyme E2 A [Pancytospora epiphaga]|nr:ubiquitin-conjugating enzyme E2 A [Pancytospora epiphaga]
MEATLRLRNELMSIRKTRPFGFYARPSEKTIFKWACQIHHRGFFYRLTMDFPEDYPEHPPHLLFDHCVYHPNIYTDNSVCLDLLSYKWNPTITIIDILRGIVHLLDYPNPLSPANTSAAKVFVKNRKEYDSKCESSNTKHWKRYKPIEKCF